MNLSFFIQIKRRFFKDIVFFSKFGYSHFVIIYLWSSRLCSIWSPTYGWEWKLNNLFLIFLDQKPLPFFDNNGVIYGWPLRIWDTKIDTCWKPDYKPIEFYTFDPWSRQSSDLHSSKWSFPQCKQVINFSKSDYLLQLIQTINPNP